MGDSHVFVKFVRVALPVCPNGIMKGSEEQPFLPQQKADLPVLSPVSVLQGNNTGSKGNGSSFLKPTLPTAAEAPAHWQGKGASEDPPACVPEIPGVGVLSLVCTI